MAKKKSAGCEYCSNYVYDEDYEYYVCDINLDEDEMVIRQIFICHEEHPDWTADQIATRIRN